MAEKVMSVAVIANVMQVVAYVDALEERLKIRFSKVDKIPQNLENIATRLPQLREAVKQTQDLLRDDRTKEAEQEKLRTDIETRGVTAAFERPRSITTCKIHLPLV